MTKRQGKGTHAWLVLAKAARSVQAHAQKSIESIDMCTSDFAVLEVLLHKGALPVNTIGKKVLLTSGSITVAVDRLAQRGLVERFDDPEDRRVRLVRLTRSGTKLIEKAFAEHQKDVDRAMSALNEEELDSLIRLLKKAGTGAEALLSQDKNRGIK